jgi:hypothetical protein
MRKSFTMARSVASARKSMRAVPETMVGRVSDIYLIGKGSRM